MHSLVDASDDLTEDTQFEYITQTVGMHLENYLKYNKRVKSELENFMSKQPSNPLKQMEIVSLHVLTSLRQKNEELCLQAISTLSHTQKDYIKQIAAEFDMAFSRALVRKLSLLETG